jgi:thiol-disulfide isomerase/thioredoxin
MKPTVLITTLALSIFASQPEKAGSQAADTTRDQGRAKSFTMVLIPPSGAALAEVLQAEVPKAKQLGQKPYAYFYADWCGPCKALRKSLDDADPLMMDAFQGAYIIQLDADTWGKKLAGTKFTVKAIPVLFELDKGGKPTGRKIDGSAWGEDIPKNMAPPLKAFFRRSK